MIKIGSDFSGVGAFPQALIRLGIEYDEVFACDMDRYARQTYCLNFGTEHDLKLASQSTIIQRTLLDEFSFDFPLDVYERKIPEESLDIYCTSPPCQAFSMAGKRMGKDDQRGILFFNSLEFIKENKPRYFIFENVKGLLSHDRQDKNAVYGRTFQEWINYLGGKSVNGVHTFFPYEDSVPYHIYFQVLNAKHYGIPQNRERVFIIGIRDDKDNDFQFPKQFPLEKRLKDVLESEVDEKYFLSDKMIAGLINHQQFNKFNPTLGEKERSCITSRVHKMGNADNYIKVGFINQDTQASQVFSEKGTSPNICAGTHGYALGYVETETKLVPEAPIVEYQLTGGKWDKTHEQSGRVYDKEGISPTIHTMGGGNQEPKIAIGAFRGRNPDNPSDRTTGANLKQTLEINESGTSNALTSVQKDNVVVIGFERTEQAKIKRKESIRKGKDTGDFSDRQLKIKSQDYADTVLANSNPTKEGLIMISSNTSKGFDETEYKIEAIKVSKEVRTEESKTTRKQTGTNAFRGKEIEFREQDFMNTITTSLTNDHFIVQSNTKKGYEKAEEEDSINFSVPSSKTRRGRVGKKVSQTLDTQCNQGIATKQLSKQQIEKLQNLEVDENIAGCITEAIGRAGSSDEYISSVKRNAMITQRIRRLTPLECFRLMDFNEDMIEKTIGSGLISDSQCYKQAGNSICVGVLAAIISKLKF